MASSCTFCSIAAGELPAFEVFADDLALGVLDVRPLFPGHVLVVPRRHVHDLTDLPATDVGPFFERVQRVAAAVPEACGAKGTFVAMNNKVSQSVPHLHVHVVPRTKGDGLRGFFWPRTKYADDAEATATAAAIASMLAR
jgi:histidine triad (HIT) family protein